MGPGKQTPSDTRDRIPLHVELVQRVQIRTCALVSATAFQNPDMFTIGVGLHTGNHPHRPTTRKFTPVIDDLIGIFLSN